MVANPSKLWVKVMRTMYNCDSLSMPLITPISNYSNIWNVFSCVWDKGKPHISWTLIVMVLVLKRDIWSLNICAPENHYALSITLAYQLICENGPYSTDSHFLFK